MQAVGLKSPSRFITGAPQLQATTNDDTVAADAVKSGDKTIGYMPSSSEQRFDHLEMQLEKLQSLVETLVDERVGIKTML